MKYNTFKNIELLFFIFLQILKILLPKIFYYKKLQLIYLEYINKLKYIKINNNQTILKIKL